MIKFKYKLLAYATLYLPFQLQAPELYRGPLNLNGRENGYSQNFEEADQSSG